MRKFLVMILQFSPFMLTVGAVYAALRLAYLHTSGKKGKGARAELLLLCFICYFFALIALVWVPEGFWDGVWYFFKNGELPYSDFKLFSGSYSSRNLILRCLKGDFGGAIREKYSITANIILFVPLGFFLPLVFKKIKPIHSVFICLAATCIIEAVQPAVGRTGDLDDIISNFTGGIIGAVIAAGFLISEKLFSNYGNKNKNN